MSYSKLEREEASRQFHVFLHKNPLLRQDIDPDKDNRYQVNIIYTLYGRVAQVWCNAPRVDFVTILDFAFPYGTKGRREFRLIRRSMQEKPTKSFTIVYVPIVAFQPRQPHDVFAYAFFRTLITPEEMQKMMPYEVYSAIDTLYGVLIIIAFICIYMFLTICMPAFARFITSV